MPGTAVGSVKFRHEGSQNVSVKFFSFIPSLLDSIGIKGPDSSFINRQLKQLMSSIVNLKVKFIKEDPVSLPLRS